MYNTQNETKSKQKLINNDNILSCIKKIVYKSLLEMSTNEQRAFCCSLLMHLNLSKNLSETKQVKVTLFS